MNQNIKVLGIDPSSSHAAYCLMDLKGSIIERGKYTLQSVNELKELGNRVDYVCIEGQYQGINAHSSLKVSHCSGIVRGILMTCMDPDCIRVIKPSTWQSKLLKVKGQDKRQKIKARSRVFAGAISKEKERDTDISDATMIAEWMRQRIISDGYRSGS